MTAAEMIAILKTMPQDTKVRYLDTWWESEGWGALADDCMWNDVDFVRYDEEEKAILMG